MEDTPFPGASRHPEIVKRLKKVSKLDGYLALWNFKWSCSSLLRDCNSRPPNFWSSSLNTSLSSKGLASSPPAGLERCSPRYSTLQVYYSADHNSLHAVTQPLANDNSGGGQFQLGMAKKSTETSTGKVPIPFLQLKLPYSIVGS